MGGKMDLTAVRVFGGRLGLVVDSARPVGGCINAPHGIDLQDCDTIFRSSNPENSLSSESRAEGS